MIFQKPTIHKFVFNGDCTMSYKAGNAKKRKNYQQSPVHFNFIYLERVFKIFCPHGVSITGVPWTEFECWSGRWAGQWGSGRWLGIDWRVAWPCTCTIEISFERSFVIRNNLKEIANEEGNISWWWWGKMIRKIYVFVYQ